MAFGTRVVFEAIREAAFGDITANYTAFGTPLSNHTRLIIFTNNLDEQIYISFDGVNDHLKLHVNSFKLLDLSSNKVRDDGLFLAVGTQIYVKAVGSLPSTGQTWIEVLAAEGGK